MTRRLLSTLVLTCALAPAAQAQTSDTGRKTPPQVQWVDFEAGLKAASASGKHIMVDVYTDWCGYCKKLDAETYAEEGVRRILAESYVSVKLKGDSSRKLKVIGQSLDAGGKTLLQFVPADTGGTSEVALSRMALRVRGFPTIAFLAPDGRLITKWDGYINAERFTQMINFIKDDLYEVMTFNDYLESLDKAREKS